MLFSEPKIPQWNWKKRKRSRDSRFSALQRAENSSMSRHNTSSVYATGRFQCSSASRKFLNYAAFKRCASRCCVSVLFSEPKIPQSFSEHVRFLKRQCFSALQRAENSSMLRLRNRLAIARGFSALQRAENSSISAAVVRGAAQRTFQCSSASRKFLNTNPTKPRFGSVIGFSALQRAENSSMRLRLFRRRARCVSVLFSEPKIPQSRPTNRAAS